MLIVWFYELNMRFGGGNTKNRKNLTIMYFTRTQDNNEFCMCRELNRKGVRAFDRDLNVCFDFRNKAAYYSLNDIFGPLINNVMTMVQAFHRSFYDFTSLILIYVL